MRIWRRCVAAILACVMLFTSANISFAAGGLDRKTNVWSATAAEIVAEHYGYASDTGLMGIFTSNVLRIGAEYEAQVPYANGTEGKEDLLAVDYRNKIVYVQSFETEGYTWLPVSAAILVDGEEQENFHFAESVTYYNNVEYYASEAFTYDGNDYTVEATYALSVSISEEEQQRIMEIPTHLMQAAKNVEKLNGNSMLNKLNLFEKLIPSLYALLSVDPTAGENGVADARPFFDETEHAAQIAAITALYQEYMKIPKDPHLDLHVLRSESIKMSQGGQELLCALDMGEEVRSAASLLFDKLQVLQNDIKRIKREVFPVLKTVDNALYRELEMLDIRISGLIGLAGSSGGTLGELKDSEDWTILDSAIAAEVFAERYTQKEMIALSVAVSRVNSYTVSEVEGTTLNAMEVTLPCHITTYDVTVTAKAQVVGPGVGNAALQTLPECTETVTLLAGTTPEEVQKEIGASGFVKRALERWNNISDRYNIGEGRYTRTVTELSAPLSADVDDYVISYSPVFYEVETNFASDMKVPYGYQLELPACTEQNGWYDYTVKYKNSEKEPQDWNQGVILTVETNVEVIQRLDTARVDSRLLDCFAEDFQYNMSPEAKIILSSRAIKSPVIKLRDPDDSAVDAITDTEEGFFIEAKDSPSGIYGMTWEPMSVTLYDEQQQNLGDVAFEGGRAFWTSAVVTHVDVNYRLNVTKVSGVLYPITLTSEEIYEYANLPHVLVQEVCAQRDVLNGNGSVTAKSILEEVEKYASFMDMNLEGLVSSEQAKKAALLLKGSENDNINVGGQSLGRGGWSATSNELALYKYLTLCRDANWSVATYYKEGLYQKLSQQATLVADCLAVIIDDPGFLANIEVFKEASPDIYAKLLRERNEVKKLLPKLHALAAEMKGPNTHLDTKSPAFAVLIENVLAAEGKTKEYTSASTLYAYNNIRRNGKNMCSLTVTVQVGNEGEVITESYKMDQVNGSERYHLFTEAEKQALQQKIDEIVASFGTRQELTEYYDLAFQGLPAAGDHLKSDIIVSKIYTPKTYVVTAEGVPISQFYDYFSYGSDYVIELPAKSDKTTAKTYYKYVFYDENGKVMEEVSVENGSEGFYTFNEADLPVLFPNGNYVLRREELRVSGEPTLTFKPKLSAELIRGAEVDAKHHILFLDANPEGITPEQFMEQVQFEVENATRKTFALNHNDVSTDYVATGWTFYCAVEDVFKKETEFEYTIIMMGDVNGDGLCNDEDLSKIVEAYFMEEDKKTTYREQLIEKLNLTQEQIWAANMNSNKKLDSNDAWTIRSKSLYWDGDKKQNQIVYRSVL